MVARVRRVLFQPFMLLHIISQGERTVVDLVDGKATLGGGEHDDIRLAGLPVKLVGLEIEGARLSIKAIRPLRIGAQLFPAHVPRLMLAGEHFTLPNDVIVERPDDEASRERRKNKSTDFLARELLRGEGDGFETRAASLTCVAGVDEGHVFPLAFVETSIGRGDETDVRLRDRTVSRQHARLIRQREGYLVEDRSTTNGLYVNGVQIKGARPLENGDVIEVGHSMLRFDAGERAPEERKPAPPQPVEPPAPPPEPTPEPEKARTSDELPPPPRVSRLTTLDITVAVIGALLILSGLGTALALLR